MKLSSPTARLSAALSLCAALTVPATALAGAGTLSTVVTPLSPAVTYSSPAAGNTPALDTYVGYLVSVANGGGNTINNIRFTGTARATDSDEAVTFSSSEGVSCTASADLTSIDCAIGQLKAGETAPAFAVFFKAPAKDSTTPLPNGDPSACATTDCVSFSGIAYYAEGTGGPTSPPQNSTTTWAADPVTLGTANPTLVKSALPKSGGTLFTGSGGVSKGSDRFATSVIVPAGLTFTTAEIKETSGGVDCANNFSECFTSDIAIPGSFSPYLTITLRQDASTILKGTKIESVLIRYIDSNGATWDVGPCASATMPNSNGIPCYTKRVYYKSKSTPGWTADLDGDFEWTLINFRNGSYKVF